MKVAFLTGGGDCPGLNQVIRGAVRVISNAGGECIGLVEGWRGAIQGNTMPLTIENTDPIIDEGGTILGSSRTNPYKKPEDVLKVIETRKRLGYDALIAIGGDDTLGVARKLYEEHNFPVIGCPKTIDNDLSSTDVTFGFDTAINIVTEAIDRIRTTAKSHRRILVVETMGRHAGWIACYSAIASGADYVLVPEEKANIDEMCDLLTKRRAAGKKFGIVVVSEGAELPEGMVTQHGKLDDFGHVQLGGIGETIAKIIEERTKIETRAVILGHLQRGGSPSAADRILGTRFGVHAGRLVVAKDFGKMVALRGTEIVAVKLADAVGTLRTLDLGVLAETKEFFKS